MIWPDYGNITFNNVTVCFETSVLNLMTRLTIEPKVTVQLS